MKDWHIYPAMSASMPFQMALDDILFQDAIEAHQIGEDLKPLLRFYYASEKSVSLGYAYAGWKQWQSHNENTAGILTEEDLPVCRRTTGGGRVIHGNDLMFTLIAPKSADESFKSVRLSYLKIHEVLKDALELLGCTTRFYRCDEALPKGKDCFVFPIATDLAKGKEKIAGGGQKRSLGIMLHQESIQLKGLPKASEIVEAFKTCFKKRFDADFVDADLCPAWLVRAETLGAEKYAVTGNKTQLHSRMTVMTV